MESEPRRSSRLVKPKRIPGFVYEEDSVRFLSSASEESSDAWHRNRQLSEGASSVASDRSANFSDSVNSRNNYCTWSELYNLPLFGNEVFSGQYISSDSIVNSVLSQR